MTLGLTLVKEQEANWSFRSADVDSRVLSVSVPNTEYRLLDRCTDYLGSREREKKAVFPSL